MVGTAQGSRHPTDEELLAYVDGELKWIERRRVRKHLQSCWECRNQTRKIEAAIAEFVNLRTDWAESRAAGPRTDPLSFQTRLEQLEAEHRPSVSWRSRMARAGRFAGRWAPRTALAAAALAGAWVWLGTSRVESVSAAELLQRAAATERSQAAGIDQPVIHRELEVRRVPPRGRERTARLEYWLDTRRDRTRLSGAAGFWGELDQVFQANRMAGTAPLTVEAYEAWRSAAKPEDEVVTPVERPDGVALLALHGTSSGTGADNEILEHELVVRAADWHPVQQTLRVRRDPGIVEYQFTEILFDVVPLSALPSDIFSHPGEPGKALREAVVSGLSRSTRSAAPAGGRGLEIKVRYQLHLVDACRQDLVTIRFEPPARIHVSGVVDTLARREELLSALEQLERSDAVRIDIRSVEEASSAAELFQALEGLELNRNPQGRKTALEIPPGPGPLLPLVEEAFGDRLPKPDLGRRSRRIASVCLAATSDAVLENAILKGLADRYGGPTMERLSPPSRRLVALMVRDHAEALDGKLRRLDRWLAPLLPPGRAAATVDSAGVPGGDWAALAREQAGRVTELQRKVERLCASSGTPPLQDLRAAVAEVHESCVALRGDVAVLLSRVAPGTRLKTRAAAQAGSAGADHE